MRLASLELKRVAIPFRVAFRHASAERSETESVWVVARSDSARIGHGEGCPRSYVSGEDLASAAAFFARQRARLLEEVHDLASLVAFVRAHEPELDANPAAWCALELALLDLLAREAGQSVEALLGKAELAGSFRYTAVLGDQDLDPFRKLFARYREFGFADFKLKLSGDLERDRAKLECVRADPDELRVRLDANNLWDTTAQASAFLAALDADFFAIEEPLRANQPRELAALARATGHRIILDESLLRAEQVGALPEPASTWIVNLRVSKMGGLLRSLDVVEAARGRGIGIVIGAQVGETSLLTRAALTVAMQSRDILLAQEGAFGPLLLEADVCDPPLMFGPGGVLEAESLSLAPTGFGLELSPELPFLKDLPD